VTVAITKIVSSETMSGTLSSLKQFVDEAMKAGAPDTASVSVRTDGRKSPPRLTISVQWTVTEPPRAKPAQDLGAKPFHTP
jgi:hypothetical protein